MKPFPTLSYSPESINHSKFTKPGKAVSLVGFPPKYLLPIILVPIASLSCVAVIKAVISILKSVFILFFFLTVFMSKMEMEMATHSSILAWKIPGTQEPGGPQSMVLQRIRHDVATKQQQNTIHVGLEDV